MNIHPWPGTFAGASRHPEAGAGASRHPEAGAGASGHPEAGVAWHSKGNFDVSKSYFNWIQIFLLPSLMGWITDSYIISCNIGNKLCIKWE